MQEKNQGSVLIYVLLTLSFLMLLGSIFISYTLSETRIARNHANNMKAYYAAEAGIELAVSGILSGNEISEEGVFFTGVVGNARYETEVSDALDYITIVSRGFAGNAVQVVKAEVIPEEMNIDPDNKKTRVIISKGE